MMETKSEIRPAAETHPAAGQTMRFRPDIEGLRALAIALIVLYHASVPGTGGGYLGIDIFFVISGYLITSTLVCELDSTGRFSPLGFLGRRARRVLPAAAFVLITVIAAGYHWLGPSRGDEIARDGIWAAMFAAEFRFADAGTSPLEHFGPLAVASQFWLVWPVALIVLIWLGFRWALPYWIGAVVAGSLAYAIWQSLDLSPVWELGAGCLLALAAGRLDRIPYRVGAVMSVVGLALIVIAALTFDLPGYASALPVVLATVLVLAGRGDSLLGVRPLQWLGRLSYSLYLWHWPVLVIAGQAYGGPLPASARALLVLGSLGLALVTYVFVENPIRRMTGPHSFSVGMALVLISTPVAVALIRLSTS
jgi:peptidoglycan/LPS O-acetylase OafA/YrhL